MDAPCLGPRRRRPHRVHHCESIALRCRAIRRAIRLRPGSSTIPALHLGPFRHRSSAAGLSLRTSAPMTSGRRLGRHQNNSSSSSICHTLVFKFIIPSSKFHGSVAGVKACGDGIQGHAVPASGADTRSRPEGRIGRRSVIQEGRQGRPPCSESLHSPRDSEHAIAACVLRVGGRSATIGPPEAIARKAGIRIGCSIARIARCNIIPLRAGERQHFPAHRAIPLSRRVRRQSI